MIEYKVVHFRKVRVYVRTGVLVCVLLCVRLGTYIVHMWETLGVGSCLPPCLKEGLQLTSACQASWPDF